MKNLFAICLLFLISLNLFSQKVKGKYIDQILNEGQAMYTLEFATWTSIQEYFNRDFNVGEGREYLSYKYKNDIRTIFYYELDTTKKESYVKYDTLHPDTSRIIQSVRISRMFEYKGVNITAKNITVFDTLREPSKYELQLMHIKKKVYKEINTDTLLFIQYKGTILNPVLLDENKQIKVFLMTRTQDKEYVPLGNDYLLTYKLDGTLITKKNLHNGFIPIPTAYSGKGADGTDETFHNHKGETSSLMTSTDICTLLLYKKKVRWEVHYVISDNFRSNFNLVDRTLTVISNKEYNAILDKKAQDEKENYRGIK